VIEHRPVSELGGGDHGWLKALHHFHIGDVGNPAHKALGNLYVWNDDEIAPGTGFPRHAHRDVEIITYVREGYVSHSDSLGNTGRTEAGDVQVMSAGTGIEHSEVGAVDRRTKLFQIWLHPRMRGGKPHWGTKPFPKSDRAGRFIVLASGFVEDTDALVICSDARVLGATLAAGQSLTYDMAPGRNERGSDAQRRYVAGSRRGGHSGRADAAHCGVRRYRGRASGRSLTGGLYNPASTP
jgi:redox-sensitive bicupin YhaK (pirin superfamily)